MLEYLKTLFDTSDFIPYGYCIHWYPDILWLHVISDILIAAAHFSIALTILYIIKKNSRLQYRSIFAVFAVFLFFGGIIHVFSFVVYWYPLYRLQAIAKALAAGVSLATAMLLLPLVPRAAEIYYLYTRDARKTGNPEA